MVRKRRRWSRIIRRLLGTLLIGGLATTGVLLCAQHAESPGVGVRPGVALLGLIFGAVVGVAVDHLSGLRRDSTSGQRTLRQTRTAAWAVTGMVAAGATMAWFLHTIGAQLLTVAMAVLAITWLWYAYASRLLARGAMAASSRPED